MKVLAFLAVAVLLSGCGTFDRLMSSAGDAEGAGETPGAESARAPEAEADLADDVPAGSGRFAPAPKIKPRFIALIEPDTLVGLSPDEVQAVIGRPVTVADRAPAKIWSYRSRECAVDVFFYLDVGSSTFRALTLDLKDARGKATRAPHCLGSIQAMNHGS